MPCVIFWLCKPEEIRHLKFNYYRSRGNISALIPDSTVIHHIVSPVWRMPGIFRTYELYTSATLSVPLPDLFRKVKNR